MSVDEFQGASSTRGGDAAETADRSQVVGVSAALRNLRGLSIVLVLAMHSVFPYLGSIKTPTVAFDQPPFEWLAFPIVDIQRWFGFDFLAAWQDMYLMSLMFFLSGLFVWPSLAAKGIWKFLTNRLIRLGAPFVFGVAIIMPIALYPAYRVRAVDPTFIDYVNSYLSLPFWPNGPMWFLWMLLALTLAPVAMYRFAPGGFAVLGRLSSQAAAHPGRYFVGFVAVAAVAYVPLAIAFTPWDWAERGLFSFQLCRPLLYFVYYLAGVGVGVHGLESGLLSPEGRLAQRWRFWLGCGLASLFLWMGLATLTLSYPKSPPLPLQIAADFSYALSGVCNFFFVLAGCLRLRSVRSRILDAWASNGFGMYLLHYAPLVWLQYDLQPFAWFAIVKAAVVFGGTLFFAYAMTIALRLSGIGRWLIGEGPPPTARREPQSFVALVREPRT